MRERTLIALFIFLPILSSHAQFEDRSLPDRTKKVERSVETQVCEIKNQRFLGPDRVENICTGFLVSPDEVVTAGHCFLRSARVGKEEVMVQCGTLKSVRAVLSQIANKAYWVSDESGEYSPYAEVDVARLKLRVKVSAEMIKVKETQKFQDYFLNQELKSEAICRSLGFGSKNEPVSIPALYEIQYQGMSMKLRSNELINSEASGERLKTSFEKGDSGGPLLCKLGPDQPEELIAVSSRYRFHEGTDIRVENVFTPIDALSRF